MRPTGSCRLSWSTPEPHSISEAPQMCRWVLIIPGFCSCVASVCDIISPTAPSSPGNSPTSPVKLLLPAKWCYDDLFHAVFCTNLYDFSRQGLCLCHLWIVITWHSAWHLACVYVLYLRMHDMNTLYSLNKSLFSFITAIKQLYNEEEMAWVL